MRLHKGISKASVALLRTQALQLRIHGHTFQAIGKALQVSTSYAHKLVETAIAEERKFHGQAKADLIELEVTRCDTYLASIAKKVQAGDTKAIDTALKVSDRRAKLLGLDAPSRSTLQGADADGNAIPIGIAFVPAPSLDQIPAEARKALESFAAPEPELEAGDEGKRVPLRSPLDG